MFLTKEYLLSFEEKTIEIEKSALCPCGLEAHTTSHVLQSCPLHKRERESTWPTESSLGIKLHGTITDLRLILNLCILIPSWQSTRQPLSIYHMTNRVFFMSYYHNKYLYYTRLMF